MPASSIFRSAFNTSIIEAGVLAITLMFGAAAQAGGISTPFLSVDINGYNVGGGQSMGPTQAGYQDWEAAEGLFLPPVIDWGNSGAAGLTKIFPTSEGNVTVSMIGFAPSSFRGARNRGGITGALPTLHQDFVFAQRALNGLGRHYIRLQLSGLMPGQAYRVTAYAREAAFTTIGSFQAWADRDALGGLDGPGAWMDAHVGAGALYQPAVGGVNNPIPTLDRSAVTGPFLDDPLAYAATFSTVASGTGVVTIYGWADSDLFSAQIQSASLLNGFQIALFAPCPADINQNGVVNVQDLLAVISNWEATGATPADVTGNGIVDVEDLLAVVSAWGPC